MAEKEKVESSVQRLREAVQHARELHKRFEELKEIQRQEAVKRAKRQAS